MCDHLLVPCADNNSNCRAEVYSRSLDQIKGLMCARVGSTDQIYTPPDRVAYITSAFQPDCPTPHTPMDLTDCKRSINNALCMCQTGSVFSTVV